VVATDVEQAPERREQRTKDEQKRLDRQLEELLQEVRVAMPGVQVLFGFLLAVPFQQGFDTITSSQRLIYFATLLAAAVATAFFIAPAAFHRINFEQHQKKSVIHVGNRQFLIGLVALALAMNGAVALVTDLIFKGSTLIVTIAVVASLFAWLWFGLGLVRRLQGNSAG
jgi:cation transport ATPase